MDRKKIVIVLSVVAVLILAGLLIWQLNKGERILNQQLQKIPAYFVDSEAKISAYKQQDEKDFKLYRGENLESGIKYEVVKNRTEALAGFLEEMRKHNWIAVGGTKELADQTIIRLNNGADTLYAVFYGVRPDPKKLPDPGLKTTVTILPVGK